VRVYDKDNRKYIDNKCLLGTLRDDCLGKCDVNLHMQNMLQVLTLLALLLQKELNLLALLVARKSRGEFAYAEHAAGAHFTCFTGTIVYSVICSTKVSVIKMRREGLHAETCCRYTIYLLYWYKKK
jgi:hypothetical protein